MRIYEAVGHCRLIGSGTKLEINRGILMSIDDLQAKWQSHDHGVPLNIDSDLLLNEVRRNHRAFELLLWQRDVSEVAAAALVTGLFATLGVMMRQWGLLLCSAGSLFVGMFFVFDRLKHRRRRSLVEDSLPSVIDSSISQVQHQIWLLRNILWWYLLPLIPGLIIFLVSESWKSRGNGVIEQAVIAAVGLICAVAFWQAYRINLREVKNTLEPRRLELEELRASLRSSSPAA
jgi:hypothetical protein